VAASEFQHFPCPSCGADLVFEPEAGSLKCPYCGHKEAIPESAAPVEEQPFEQHLQIHPEQMGKLAANALEVLFGDRQIDHLKCWRVFGLYLDSA